MDVVSIVVPVFNVNKYLNRCLESLVNQTYFSLEIILIDDGSDDGSEKLCDAWRKKDSRIIVLHQRNAGLSMARNVGIDMASGKFLFFVDSDDWLETDAIEKLINIQQKYHADIVCCGVATDYEDGTRGSFTSSKMLELNNKEALKELMLSNTVCSLAWNKLYLLSLWKVERFPKNKLNEDEFTIYKIVYSASKVVYLGDELYHYFQRSNGLMNQIKEDGILSVIEALEERNEWLEGKQEWELRAVSLLKTVERVKYLFRCYSCEKETKKDLLNLLMDLYKSNAKKIYSNKNISLKDKAKTAYWQVVLPYKCKGRC